MALLEITNLCAQVKGHPILKGVNLTIEAGEVHAIMGPNGAGKSTLLHVLAGKPGYEVSAGQIHLLGQDVLAMAPEERALAGLFLAMQYPTELPGVNNAYFLKAALNAKRAAASEPELDAVDFLALMKSHLTDLGMDQRYIERNVNDGFSGGEKKRNEILQMALLEPRLCLLDETDSGLDIDALKVVSETINRLRKPNRSMLLITHYQRLLDSIVPDFIHVMANGVIVRSGGKELAEQLEQSGYQTEQPTLHGMAS